MPLRSARWLSFGAALCLVACGPAREPRPAKPSAHLSGNGAAASAASPPPAPPTSLSAASSTDKGAPERTDWAEGTHEIGFFAAMCLDTPRLSSGSTHPRACIVRGHVLSLARTVARSEDGVDEPNVRALELAIDPDDAVPCRTPLDTDDKALRDEAADWSDLARARKVLLVGASRLEPALSPGRAVCGWTKIAPVPGLPGGGHPGWEGQLSASDGSKDGALMAAWSDYFVPSRSRMLARRWSFGRAGKLTLEPVDEGGAFVRHSRLNVQLDGAALTVDPGSETEWPAKSIVLRAESFLTTGATPVFMGHWDGYRFSAVRAHQ